MFRGCIPQDMRNILHQMVGAWLVQDIYVGCSGNFTVERTLASLERFRLHGNDVTVYSCAIGAYLSGQPFHMALRDGQRETFGWLEPYLGTTLDTAATVMLATRLAEGLRSDGSPKHNAYYNRLLPALRTQWPQLHVETVTKLAALPVRLASYHAGDVVPWARSLPPGVGFVSYPPFFSGDYEAMFSKLDLLFEWDKPVYEDIGDGHIQEFLAAVTDRPFWAFGSHQLWPEYQSCLRGVTQTSNRGVPIFIYASVGPRRVVLPQQDIEPVLVPRLLPGCTVGDSLRLAHLNQGQFQALRSQYMNPGIKPGQASEAVAVLVDGYLVGVFAFSASPHPGAQPGQIYLLSDFPVAPSDYPRLSKLVLYAALSRESQLLAERISRHRVRGVLTTAFSDKPVSMKYRGLFALHSRKENSHWQTTSSTDPAAYYQQRYQLNYLAPAGQWTLAEGLVMWKDKHGRRA